MPRDVLIVNLGSANSAFDLRLQGSGADITQAPANIRLWTRTGHRSSKSTMVRNGAPTKYELVINLKAAKAIGLTVPPFAPFPR